VKILKFVFFVSILIITTGCANKQESTQSSEIRDFAENSSYCRKNYYSASASVRDRRNRITAITCDSVARDAFRYRRVFGRERNRGPHDDS